MPTTSLCVQLTVCCSFTIHIDNAHHLDAYVAYCASRLSFLISGNNLQNVHSVLLMHLMVSRNFYVLLIKAHPLQVFVLI